MSFEQYAPSNPFLCRTFLPQTSTPALKFDEALITTQTIQVEVEGRTPNHPPLHSNAASLPEESLVLDSCFDQSRAPPTGLFAMQTFKKW